MERNVQENQQSVMQEFFQTCLQELYWSETHLIDVLNTMCDAATSPELKDAFNQHREETREHKRRLEEVFSLLSIQAQGEPCMGLQGLFDEGWQVIDETEENTAQRDVALIIAAQKVEHYEIATYGSLITLAKTMRQNRIAELLAPTLEEEKNTDLLLTNIAEAGINVEASMEKANGL